MKSVKEQNYSSTYNFVNVNNLDATATELFGAGWEAEDDISQIMQILEHLGEKYFDVNHIEGMNTNEDISVVYNEERREIDGLKADKKALIEVLQDIIGDDQVNGKLLPIDRVNAKRLLSKFKPQN